MIWWTDLTPLAVMHANMVFFHRKAGGLMAAILALPTLTHDEVTDAQVQALKDMAGLLRPMSTPGPRRTRPRAA